MNVEEYMYIHVPPTTTVLLIYSINDIHVTHTYLLIQQYY